MRNVVVTGAAGFVGRHVVEVLLARGETVVGIDRRSWTPALGETSLTLDLTSGSACDRTLLADVLADADAVLHLAGRPGVRDTHPDADMLRWRDNVVAGERVLAATRVRTPLVVASSSSVYGTVPVGPDGPLPSREVDPRRPRGAYGRSKAALEDRCRLRAAAGGHVAVARPFTVAGEGQRPDMALARWIADARAGVPLTVLGGGHRGRDVTDVRQVAEGLVRMAEREVTGTVNLGTGTVQTLSALVDAVAAVLDVPVSTVQRQAPPEEPPVTRADTRRCLRLLGFTPRTDLPALVRRQVAATRELLAEAR